MLKSSGDYELSTDQLFEAEKYITKLKKEYFTWHTKYAFTHGDHYAFYKKGIDCDLTSNVVETQNNTFNKDATKGRKSVADFAIFMRQHKAKMYPEKLFKFQNKRWNKQKKTTRDKWTAKRQIFDDFGFLPLFMQADCLIKFLINMGQAWAKLLFTK